MRRSLRFALFSFAFLTLAFFGCSKTKQPGGGTCPGGGYSCGQLCDGDDPPAECAETCGVGSPCPAGFYCGTGGTCTADCATSGDAGCPGGVCTGQGVCQEPPDAGGSGGGGGGSGAGGGGGDVCARESVMATTVTPNVVFLIDRSGSMQGELDLTSVDCDCDPGSSTIPYNCYAGDCNAPEHSRWNVLRDVLIGTGGADTGLIGGLEDQVRFGLATYTASGSDNCPDLDYAPSGGLVAALNNHEDIADEYSTLSPGTYTPTGDAVTALVNELDDTGLLDSPDPTIIILATDGRPGRCSNITDTGDIGSTASFAASVDAVASAHAAGVRTFVLAVASESQLESSHVNALANAGVGDDSGETESAESWRITSLTDLQNAIDGIVQGEISCTVNLQGEVTDLAAGCATGEVAFIGPGDTRTPIACDPEDGWSLLDESTMRLNGDACDTLRNTPGLTLDASFPCDVVIIDPL
jgi:hypothetical protein